MNNIKVKAIVAHAENGTIGVDGKLPWRISEDMRHFKKYTMGKVVLMGRKTYESLPGPLPGRDIIVLSRTPRQYDDVLCITGKEDLPTAMEHYGKDEVIIAGGSEIYDLFKEEVIEWSVTKVLADVEGDTYLSTIPSGCMEYVDTGTTNGLEWDIVTIIPWKVAYVCKCCGVDTDDIDEYYMVKDDPWMEAHAVLGDDPTGMLCIGCLEDRIGRQLVREDFLACRINTKYFKKSDRLTSRLLKRGQQHELW